MKNIERKIREAIERSQEGEDTETIVKDMLAEAENEREAEIDGMLSLQAMDQDWDEERYFESIGMSEYDLNPGIQYNDAGEPKGYM